MSETEEQKPSDEMIGIVADKMDEAAKKEPPLPGIGHNRVNEKISGAENVDKATASRLKSIISRVERLNEEKDALQEDIKEIFGEAKATGFDVKVIRQIIRLRKVELDKRREAEMLLETYKAAIGME